MLPNKQLIKSERSKKRKFNWICGIGKHQEVWDYYLINNFARCFDFAWGTLQHEVDIPRNQFRSKLKKNKAYIGRFAEIKKVSSKITAGSGMFFADSIIVFDDPEEADVELSKPVYAGLVCHLGDVIWGYKIFGDLGREKIINRLSDWSNLKFLGEEYNSLNNLESLSSLSLSNYPLIITSSPFVLSKVCQEGLIGCLVPNLLSLVSKPQKKQQEGILNDLYQWLAPCPKRIYIVEENLEGFSQEVKYNVNKEYSNYWQYILQRLKYQTQKLGSHVDCFEVDKGTPSSYIVDLIRERELLF